MNDKPRVDEALASYEIVKQLVALGYPHNFQHENSWVVDYCYNVGTIIKQAMEIDKCQKQRAEREKENDYDD